MRWDERWDGGDENEMRDEMRWDEMRWDGRDENEMRCDMRCEMRCEMREGEI